MSANQTSFDDLRIALMQSYHQKVTNHIGYIISFAIAILTIIFSKDIISLFNSYQF